MQYELYHHGILGMKWGIRRYQNKDGTLTAAGRKRYLNSDGSLTKAGVEVAKKDASEKGKYENLSKSARRYESIYQENPDGKITEYVKDKYLDTIVRKNIIERGGVATEYFVSSTEALDDSDIQKGKLFVDEVSRNSSSSLSDILYNQVYNSANKEDRRFLDENRDYAKYVFANSFSEDVGHVFQEWMRRIENTTINWYTGKPVTKEAERLVKELSKWGERSDSFSRDKYTPEERKHAFEMYRKTKQKLIDLTIRDQGYTPSDITRAYFDPYIFWS